MVEFWKYIDSFLITGDGRGQPANDLCTIMIYKWVELGTSPEWFKNDWLRQIKAFLKKDRLILCFSVKVFIACNAAACFYIFLNSIDLMK